MGLFDTVRFKEPLPEFPDKIITDGQWAPQTKSLYCMLMEYAVRDGKLYKRNGKRFLYHGDLELTCTLDSDEDERKTVYYIARFTEGELQWIKRDGEVDYGG